MKTVIEMAREAGFHVGDQFVAGASEAELERFAELVRAEAVRENSAEYRMGWNDGQIAERTACAKVCEEPTEQTYEVTTSLDGFESTKQMRMPKSDRDCAAAIRARGSNT